MRNFLRELLNCGKELILRKKSGKLFHMEGPVKEKACCVRVNLWNLGAAKLLHLVSLSCSTKNSPFDRDLCIRMHNRYLYISLNFKTPNFLNKGDVWSRK